MSIGAAGADPGTAEATVVFCGGVRAPGQEQMGAMTAVPRRTLDVRAVDRYTRRVEAWMASRGTPQEPAAFQLSQEAWRLLLRVWALDRPIRRRKEQT